MLRRIISESNVEVLDGPDVIKNGLQKKKKTECENI